MASLKIDLSKIGDTRRATGESQRQFWARFGVSPSCANRYEGGHSEVPSPTGVLIALYLSGRVTDDDLAQARKLAGR